MKYLLEGEETERLKFRLLEEKDFDTWQKLFDDQSSALFLALDTNLNKEELCRAWFDKVFSRYENDLGGMNVLVLKETGEMIGQCGLLIQTVEDERRLEIGYSILPEHRGKGFASEAAQKCRDFAFKNDFEESLISVVHAKNKASEKVARKNGMVVEKSIKDYKGIPVRIFKIDRFVWEEIERYR